MTLPIILFIFIIAAFVGLALVIKKDAKKAKDFVVTTDGILLGLALLSLVLLGIDNTKEIFGSPDRKIIETSVMGLFYSILLITVVLIAKISRSKNE